MGFNGQYVDAVAEIAMAILQRQVYRAAFRPGLDVLDIGPAAPPDVNSRDLLTVEESDKAIRVIDR